jgi:hypothetical protein
MKAQLAHLNREDSALMIDIWAFLANTSTLSRDFEQRFGSIMAGMVLRGPASLQQPAAAPLGMELSVPFADLLPAAIDLAALLASVVAAGRRRTMILLLLWACGIDSERWAGLRLDASVVDPTFRHWRPAGSAVPPGPFAVELLLSRLRLIAGAAQEFSRALYFCFGCDHVLPTPEMMPADRVPRQGRKRAADSASQPRVRLRIARAFGAYVNFQLQRIGPILIQEKKFRASPSQQAVGFSPTVLQGHHNDC